MLMYGLSSGDAQEEYAAKVENFLDMCLNFDGPVTQTPCGLAWLRQDANTAFIALLAAERGLMRDEGREWAEKQLKYMMGRNAHGFSYQVGYSSNFPFKPHHRAASCPLAPDTCDWPNFDDPLPNPHILTRARVGGPDENDDNEDRRDDDVMNEVSTAYNAGFQSALAGELSLERRGQLPDVAPSCQGR